MAQPNNKANPRDDIYKVRCYSEDKKKAMERAMKEGSSLGYLVACFLAGYAYGMELPLWMDDIKLENRKPTSETP